MITRNLSTTKCLNGKKNFRKFLLINKRGTREFKERQRKNPDPDIPIDRRGVKNTGVYINGNYREISEMIPEIIVPDLTDCQLFPYVSYKSPEVVQSAFTSLDLFNAIYSSKIVEDLKNEKLNDDCLPKEPSSEEQLSPDEAWIAARKTGSDIF